MPEKNSKTFAPEVVFQDYMNATRGRTKNPYHYDPVPDEIVNAPVEWYVYNVSPLPRTIFGGGLGTQYIPACKEKGGYSKPLEVRRYIIDWADMGEYRMAANIVEGEKRVHEMVSPNNEPDLDLRNWGIFYSRMNPPMPAEVQAATARVEHKFDSLVKYADFLYEVPARRGEITEVYRIAARWMNFERPWCTVSKAMGICPGCARPVEKTAAKHECGAILNWENARKLRLVSKQEYEEAVQDGLVPGVKKG